MPTPPTGGSRQHPLLRSGRWRRWSPYALILGCVFIGWIHGAYFIPQKPDGVSASKWALRESQAIQDGANYALLLIAGVVDRARPRALTRSGPQDSPVNGTSAV
jgi:hypothetical protein